MVKLIDILNLMEQSQDLRICIAFNEWYGLNAITATKVLPKETLNRGVSSIKINDDSVFIFLEEVK